MRPPESWKNARLTLGIALVTSLTWAIPTFLGYERIVAFWGGFIHLFFNMMMLVFCGRPVEAILGRRGFAILYIVGAFAAAGAYFIPNQHETVPMVGASGAISAVLGAYALLFGRNKVKVGSPGVATLLHAAWLFAAWTVINLLVGATFEVDGARIAVAAHIGGFLAGLALAKPLLLLRWRGA